MAASQADVEPRDRALFRSSRRVSVTLSYVAYSRLLKRSDQEGRSLSNLSAFLLESALGAEEEHSSR
jgi:macrodomain Ter protein organizer (MatP/YcbG family)